MKTLRQFIEDGGDFQLSEYMKVQYNAMDHDLHKTGVDHKREKTQTVVYSVYAINLKMNIAFTQNINAWGQYLDEVHYLDELAVYEK